MSAQLKHFAVQDIETVEGLILSEPGGAITVRDDYHNHPESKRILDYYLEILAPSGAVLYRNDRLANRSLGAAPFAKEGAGGYSPRSGTLPDGTRLVIVSRRHVLDGRPLLIRLALSEEPVWRAFEQFLLAAGIVFPIMAGVATVAGYRMSRRILEPVQNMASRASEITSSRLHERLPVHGAGDELDHLAEVFNRTLTRLDESFRQLRQFTSDASHELRTPLAAIRSIGEVGLERDGTREEYRELIGSMLEEVNRLTRLVDELLMISRGDSGAIHLNFSTIGVFDLAREIVSILEPLAEEKQQRLVLTGDAEATIQADPILLRQALINILHNAIKYSPAGSATSVQIERDHLHSIVISVRDAGPGIAAEHRARIFDRFYRVDQGRSRDAGGFGLGLSIAQWAVQAHGGAITVSGACGEGSTFRIVLPTNAAA
ncbi:MAG TPA: ATP-binding protein [Bryobacteraceae bacterium]|jgi:heavy metal sensor kinase